jgi:hypothetical protein
MKAAPATGVLAYLLAATCAFASGTGFHTDLSVDLAGLERLRIVRNEAFGFNYPDAQCVDLLVANSGGKVGLVCRSRSRKFVEDMGISEFSSLSDIARPKKAPTSGCVIATPTIMSTAFLATGASSKPKIIRTALLGQSH